MKVLRIVGALCFVPLFTVALMLAWYRSELSELAWLLISGHGSEGYPNASAVELVFVVLVGVLVSSALTRRFFRWRRRT